jgi:hypothetical protein
MATAIRDLLGDDDARARMGALARQDVQERWVWERWSGRLLSALGLAP